MLAADQKTAQTSGQGHCNVGAHRRRACQAGWHEAFAAELTKICGKCRGIRQKSVNRWIILRLFRQTGKGAIMKVLVAEKCGFCPGVETPSSWPKTLAQVRYIALNIIHNEDVVCRLSESGLKTIKSIEQIHSGTVLIRS